MALERCLTCNEIIYGLLYSISHTIKPDAKLCPKCGQRESTDPVWADGLRIGFERHEAALAVQRKEPK